jgi:alpha-L-rhamnosidase
MDMARKPGRQLTIRPAIVGNLKWVRVSYDSVLGKIVSNWQRVGNHLSMQFVIPPNTTARIDLPATNSKTLEINQRLLPHAGVHVIRILHNRVIIEARSGRYKCISQYDPKH